MKLPKTIVLEGRVYRIDWKAIHALFWILLYFSFFGVVLGIWFS